jgi:hypothetical protein
MTKHQDRTSQQLELRLLSVLNTKPEARKSDDAAVKARRDAQSVSTSDGASEHDMSVYRKIASNYFDSLRKG